MLSDLTSEPESPYSKFLRLAALTELAKLPTPVAALFELVLSPLRVSPSGAFTAQIKKILSENIRRLL
jgi:hypothetical protein